MTDHSSSQALAPDPLAIERHLDLLFGYLDGFVPLRLLSELGTPSQPARNTFYPARGSDLITQVQKAAAWAHGDSRGVFVVPGVVAAPGRAKADDVVESGALLIDLDVGDIAAKRDYLLRHIGPASLILASGGRTGDGQDKLHIYWRLTEPAGGEQLAKLVALRAEIARAVGGDSAFDSIHQPIRVAGTIHGKHGVRSLVRILEDTAIEYELGDLGDRIAEMPFDARLARGADSGEKARFRPTQLMTQRICAGAVDTESRYSALSKIIGHWIRQIRHRRTSLDEAWQAVVEHNAALITPPWPEDRLRRELLALLRVDEARNGPFPDGDRLEQDPGSAPRLSEDALAAEFVKHHGLGWRYVAMWGAWMRWTGTLWSRDETFVVREEIRQVCRAAIAPDTTPAEAKRVASEKTIRAVERIASADPAIAARVSDWDSWPYLLNTPSGIVDLDTGEVLRHEPARMLTQITAASIGSQCPVWRTFLAEIAGDDTLLPAYLARLCGYCLTASTDEQVFAFLYGNGANGKSVFLRTVASVLGSYAATAPLGAFMSSRNDAHPTDLAGLVGNRLVTVSETEPGRAWAETRIKTITGGDPVRARLMRRDFFEFVPSFKLIVAGNHRPRLTGVGEAIRRRMHLVPFTVTIPPERRDKRLAERLLAEKDGILAWMLEGYTEWQRIGLAAPPSVVQSAEDYFDDEDLTGQWIAECCVLGPQQRTTARELFASWGRWAEQTGAETGSQKTLGDALRERGFVGRKVLGARGWVGLAVRRGAPDKLEDAG